jgi:hypothetical protein
VADIIDRSGGDGGEQCCTRQRPVVSERSDDRLIRANDGRIRANDLQTIRLQGDDLASGPYFVRVTGSDISKTRRLTVVR